nr:kinesin [Hymenolepis microstoma]
MNRKTFSTLKSKYNSSSNNFANDNPSNEDVQQPTIRMRNRPLERTNLGDTLTPQHLRRPFWTSSESTSNQRLLDNQCSGLSVNSNEQNIRPTTLDLHLKLNAPGPNDSVGNFDEIREKLVQANMLTERANALLYERRSNVRYHVSLQVPIQCLNQAKRKSRRIQCEPVIEVRRGNVRERSISLARMQSTLRELEISRDDPESNSLAVTSTTSVFNELKTSPVRQAGLRIPNGDLVLIGVANLALRCLLFVREFSYKAPIINPKGRICGRIDVELSTTIVSDEHKPRQLFSTPSTLDFLDQEFVISDGNILELRVSIREAVGVPTTFTKMILCHYQMLGVEEPIVVLPKLESFATQGPPDPTNLDYESSQCCTFDHRRIFRLPLTRRVLFSLADYVLSIDVYGNVQEVNLNASIRRRASNRNQALINFNSKGVEKQDGSQLHRANSPPPVRTTKLRRYKSDLADRRKPNFLGAQTTNKIPNSPSNVFSNEVASRLAEEWLKVQRRIDFWVAIEELSEEGNFKKVAVVPDSDVKTGGIYQLCQGLNRRIRVLIRPNELSQKERGVLPLICSGVSEVSVGCVTRYFTDNENGQSQFVKNRYTPDSYQEVDLEMVRHNWCKAMDEWQYYLQSNLQALAKKREKDAGDEAKEGYLLNRWVSSIQERDAILVPAPGSSLPGAPATEVPPLGVEQHTPLIFADIDGEKNKHLMVGACSYLDGEDSKSFVTLPVIKNYATLIGALASWDSNLHESDLLNKITPSSERIYLIVKVHILVRKPVEMTLVLRKRICVKICRRSALSTIFRSPFSRIVSNEKKDMLWTGVAYQLVAGIPKMAPYAPNSAGPELENQEKNTIESFAEEYMKTIQSVNSELYLDGLRQEVALRETLAKNLHLRQPFDLDNLGFEALDSSGGEPVIPRSRSFNDPPKKPVLTANMRQRSQTRPRNILYPNLDTILSETDITLPTPMSFSPSGQSSQIEPPTGTKEAEVHRLTVGFKNTTITTPTPVSEELMAWSRRDKAKQRNASTNSLLRGDGAMDCALADTYHPHSFG